MPHSHVSLSVERMRHLEPTLRDRMWSLGIGLMSEQFRWIFFFFVPSSYCTTNHSLLGLRSPLNMISTIFASNHFLLEREKIRQFESTFHSALASSKVSPCSATLVICTGAHGVRLL